MGAGPAKVVLKVPLQFKLALIVTVYVPLNRPLRSSVLETNPSGPDHVVVYGVPPPVIERSIDPALASAQTLVALVKAALIGSGAVSTSVESLRQPLASRLVPHCCSGCHWHWALFLLAL